MKQDGLASRLSSSLDALTKTKSKGDKSCTVKFPHAPSSSPATQKSALLSASLEQLIKKKAVNQTHPVVEPTPQKAISSLPSSSAVAPPNNKRPLLPPVVTNLPMTKKAKSQPSPTSPSRKQKRPKIRFSLSIDEDGEGEGWMKTRLVGTCLSIEKDYFRLTSQPHPSTVRPHQILEKALANVKAKWKTNPGGIDSPGYHYAREQLKSIRQDLTVQHIRDKLAVQTYETHARVALEVGDGAEFTACHTRLKRLYAEGNEGNREEFCAYGVLLAQSTAGIGRGRGQLAGANLVSELADLSQDDTCLEHPFVTHALAVSRAFRQGDFHTFSSLYAEAPRMSPYLMDRMLPKMRVWAMQALTHAYRPTAVPLEVVAKALAVDQDGSIVENLVEALGGRVDRKNQVMETAPAPAPQPHSRPQQGLASRALTSGLKVNVPIAKKVGKVGKASPKASSPRNASGKIKIPIGFSSLSTSIASKRK